MIGTLHTRTGAKTQSLKNRGARSLFATQIFSSAPFALMIFTLLLIHSEGVDRLLAFLPPRLARRIDRAIRGRSPGGLGKLFVQE